MQSDSTQVPIGSTSLSVLATLIGRAWRSLGNRRNAIVYYHFALQNDAGSYEAFRALFHDEMLNSGEQAQLLAEIDFSKVDSIQRQSNQILYWNYTHKVFSSAPSFIYFADSKCIGIKRFGNITRQ